MIVWALIEEDKDNLNNNNINNKNKKIDQTHIHIILSNNKNYQLKKLLKKWKK